MPDAHPNQATLGKDADPWTSALESPDEGLELLLGDDRPEIAATLRRWVEEADEDRRRRERRKRLRELSSRRARRRMPNDPFGHAGASSPLAVRLPRWLEEQLRQDFQEMEITPSEGLRQILEEWWVGRRYPALEYRGQEFVRTASIRGGPTVTEWLGTTVELVLPLDVREQVLDYVELFKWRFEPRLTTAPRAARAR